MNQGCYVIDVLSSFPYVHKKKKKKITQIYITPGVSHVRSVPPDHNIPSSTPQKPVLKTPKGGSLSLHVHFNNSSRRDPSFLRVAPL